jgi:hypothetical protein
MPRHGRSFTHRPLILRSVPTVVVLEQEGFRFRNDDGSEAAATWRQAQDVADSIAKETNVRLRVIVNETGGSDPASQQYGLEYRKQGDTDWRTVAPP